MSIMLNRLHLSIIDTDDLVTQLRNRTIMRHNDDRCLRLLSRILNHL